MWPAPSGTGLWSTTTGTGTQPLPRPKGRPVRHWAERIATSKDKGLLCGFRSGLESANAQHIESLGQPVEYETFVIPWVMPQSLRRYTADFRLMNGIIVETKGIFEATDRAKHLFIRVQYPDLDIRFVFSRGKSPIAPGSKTTLGDWASTNGFKWAEKLIPAAWLQEAGPEVSPEEALRKGPVGYHEFLQKERSKRGSR